MRNLLCGLLASGRASPVHAREHKVLDRVVETSVDERDGLALFLDDVARVCHVEDAGDGVGALENLLGMRAVVLDDCDAGSGRKEVRFC